MSDFYDVREVKRTKKAHQCHGCLQVIPEGTHAWYQSGVYEGDFFASYMCDTCEDWLKKNPRYFEEGIYPGDVGEVRREKMREKANA